MSLRPTPRTLFVRDDLALVQDFDRLDPPIREEIGRALAAAAVAPAFTGPGASTLAVPRHLAPVLGRVIRPASRKAVALERIRAATTGRSYPEVLDADEICRRGRELADLIEARRGPLTRLLVGYEAEDVAEDEIARTVDLLRSLDENRACFVRRVGDVATFLPCNQPLYALACFGLVPALMARRVHVRPPAAMGPLIEEVIDVLGLGARIPGLIASRQDRAEFVAGLGDVEAVIFTGTPDNAIRLRRRFDHSVLFIVNGSGHNPIVVTETANVERAVASILRVQLYNQGQDCASPSAILVHRDRHPELLERLRAAVAAVRIGPLTRREHLRRVQSLLHDNAHWLDPATPGVIRIGEAIVEPTLVDRPLARGGNFTESFAPIFFVHRYDRDADLAGYFEDPRYPLHAMYVTVFGDSRYVDGLPARPLGGRIVHDDDTILRDTDLHAPGVERGTRPYGGYGAGASYLHRHGTTVARPTLPQRDLFEQLVRPTLDAPPEAAPPPQVPDPAALAARFLDRAIAPVHLGDSAVTPLVDGAAYFAEVGAALRRARGPGDAIFLLTYQIDPAWRIPGDPSGLPIGHLLSQRAVAGVDVRVVLNGTRSPLNPWRENRAAARALGALPGLAGRVLVDGSGASLLGSHHQKAIVVHAGGETIAFASGMDPVADHWDRPRHDDADKRWPDGTRWGWHDAGVKVCGAAVRRLWDNFRDRWALAGGAPALGACPTGPAARSAHAVQVLRSCYRRGAAPVHELHRAIKRAIAAAERYIYVEDQFLCDHAAEHLGWPIPAAPVAIPRDFSMFPHIAARMRARPDLKVIFVGSGKSDPIDFLPGPRNRRLTPSLRRLVDAVPPACRKNLRVWRLEDVTVHSKLVLIDDAFAAIGSANFRTRSFFGLDTELQVALVAADGTVRDLRAALWAEHLGMQPIEASLLADLDRALDYASTIRRSARRATTITPR